MIYIINKRTKEILRENHSSYGNGIEIYENIKNKIDPNEEEVIRIDPKTDYGKIISAVLDTGRPYNIEFDDNNSIKRVIIS